MPHNKEKPNTSRTDGKARCREESGETDASGAPRLYHTLQACQRCRTRKTRCTPELPKCGPCERARAPCEFWDAAKKKMIPRSYAVHLQQRVQELEDEVKMKEALLVEAEQPNEEELVRGIGAVRFENYDHFKEPRYVGSSSGVTVTRLVLESARKNLDKDAFKDMTEKHKDTFKNAVRREPGGGQNSAQYSNTPARKLPARPLGEKMVELFCDKALYMLPILHEPTFKRDVAEVYNGSRDPIKNFQLRMVLAISLNKYSSQFAQLADSYFLAGLEYFEQIMDPMDHRTLQCILIMVQYCLIKPTRIAAYHMVGLAVRLCIQLGYHQERTIMLSETPLDPITKDMRRRIFWTLASMEYGLSHVLGRPSAFATADAHVDVKFYEPVDDSCITAGGIVPGPPSPKKLISKHFFEMRRLQAEIRQTLYQNPRETPRSSDDYWFKQMHAKCREWRASCPKDDHGSGLSVDWFDHRYHNIVIFMYRPSPQVPQPSLQATITCYNSAVDNVYREKRMYEKRTADFSWVFMHQVYTVTLTIIWSVYNREIRRLHPREEVEAHIKCQLQLLTGLAEMWPGSEAAADLFSRLAGAAFQNYEQDEKAAAEAAQRAGEDQASSGSRDASFSPSSAILNWDGQAYATSYAQSDSSGSNPYSTPSPRSTSSQPASFGAFPPPSAMPPLPSSTPFDGSLKSPITSISLPQFQPQFDQTPAMMFDPGLMQTMFASIPGTTLSQAPETSLYPTGIPEFLQSWDPNAAAYPQAPPGLYPHLGNGGTYGAEHDTARYFDPNEHQEELMRILESESQASFQQAQARSWVYDQTNSFF